MEETRRQAAGYEDEKRDAGSVVTSTGIWVSPTSPKAGRAAAKVVSFVAFKVPAEKFALKDDNVKAVFCSRQAATPV